MNQCLFLFEILAAIMVVLRHATLNGIPGLVITTLSSFAVPFFFMVSGFYLVKDNDSQISLKTRIQKRIVSILKILAIMTAIFTVIEINKQGFSTFSKLFALDSLFELIVFDNSIIAGHSWYLLAVIEAYFFFWLFSDKLLYSRTFVVVLSTMTISWSLIRVFSQMVFPRLELGNLIYYRNWYGMAIPFMALGVWLKRNINIISNRPIKFWWLLAALGGVTAWRTYIIKICRSRIVGILYRKYCSCSMFDHPVSGLPYKACG